MEPTSWRLLNTGLGEPAWNMALDEALLECFQPGDAPTLRLYGWSPQALSLGRFQASGEITPPKGAVLVRRISGGAALFHRSDEVTYSVVAEYRLFGGRGPKKAYHRIHEIVRAAVDALAATRTETPQTHTASHTPAGDASRTGLCFDLATDYDLCVDGHKLVGSAQRRRGGIFLQHGSLPLSPDPLTETSTSLAELLGRAPSRACVEDALTEAFRQAGCDLAPGAVSEGERQAAEQLRASRYTDRGWTLNR
jgi:lipoyl(octanoyl) transferase